MTSRQGDAVLTEPVGAPDNPVGALSEPRGALAGFESGPLVHGSAPDNRMWRPTVSRCTPSWRAMFRWDQPLRASARIACTSAILS